MAASIALASAVVALEQMAIDAERDVRAPIPKTPADHDNIEPSRNERRRMRVPQGVE